MEGHPGAEVDHRDRVRDHVVQLPGHPQPLLVGPPAPLLDPPLAPHPGGPPDPQRHPQQHPEGEQEPGKLVGHPVAEPLAAVGHAQGHQHRQQPADPGGQRREPPPVRRHRGGVDGHAQRQEDRPVGVPGGQPHGRRRGRHRQHGHRVAAPERHRRRRGQQQPPGEDARGAAVRLVAGGADGAVDPEDGQAGGQQGVVRPGRTSGPDRQACGPLHPGSVVRHPAPVILPGAYAPC